MSNFFTFESNSTLFGTWEFANMLFVRSVDVENYRCLYIDKTANQIN